MRPSRAQGVVFTPLELARWSIAQTTLCRDWVSGAHILEPSLGQGDLLWALVEETRSQGFSITSEMWTRIQGWEIDSENYQKALETGKILGWPQPEQGLHLGDFLEISSEKKFDWILANPPWVSFPDLPESSKPRLKPLFLKYFPETPPRSLLWGSSRMDLSALFTAKALTDHLQPGGQGLFFLPLSLAVPQGAHGEFFRRWIQGPGVGLLSLRAGNFAGGFSRVSTDWGLYHFGIRARESWDYWKYEKDEWKKIPIPGALVPIPVPPGVGPRQGINTCGANSIFIFNEKPDLEPELVFPCVKSGSLATQSVEKWILIPVDSRGMLKASILETQFPKTWRYLKSHQAYLEQRRGLLIQAQIRRGFWYALLGLGPYTWAPWKIIWESYGKREWKAYLLGPHQGKPWIPAQALFGYLGFPAEAQARRVFEALNPEAITQQLLSEGRGGRPSWAQPGTMKAFFTQTADQWT